LVSTEEKLVALAERVAQERLSDPARSGRPPIARSVTQGVGRCFITMYLGWDYDPVALDYEERLFAGRYALAS
jgi:hypothetical protein